MTKRILIMGLPGAGKTYLAERLKEKLESYSKPIQENSLSHSLYFSLYVS